MGNFMRKILSVRFRVFPLAGLCLVLFSGLFVEAGAQAFTKADSGWVRLFNGTDFNGWYSRTYNVGGVNAPLVVPPAAPYSIEYAGTDTAAIRVGANSPQGNIGTLDTTFSHYQVRVEAKFDVFGTTNGGMTYHTRESANRMQNNWPRSIEFQFRQNETGHAFSIQQVTFNIRTNNNSTWSPTGTTLRTGCEIGCNARSYSSSPVISTRAAPTGTETRWLRYRLIARGADSATHIVQDTVVLTLANIRIFNDSTRATGSTNSGSNSASNFTPNGPHGSGGLTFQAEGTTLRYRRLEIMRFPPSTPKDEPYLHRLFLDYPHAPMPVPVATSSNLQLQWRSIGTIPKVKIERRIGSGNWVTVTDSTPNTGTYNTTIGGGMPPADSVRFRISSVDYVWADSTDGTGPVSVRQRVAESGNSLFEVRSGALTIPGTAEFTRMEIRDASGRQVRALPLSGATARWDLTGADGVKVRPGLYFFRLTGSGTPLDGRVMVF
jgi:hypothetical protein